MNMKNEKLLNYHFGMSDKKTNVDFMADVVRIKENGRRLSNNEKALLLRKARTIVYCGK